MAGTRSSARLSGQNSSSPANANTSPGDRKRKIESTGTSPSAKRGKKTEEPKQQTLEETLSTEPSQQNGKQEKSENSMDIDKKEPERSDSSPAAKNEPEETVKNVDQQGQDKNDAPQPTEDVRRVKTSPTDKKEEEKHVETDSARDKKPEEPEKSADTDDADGSSQHSKASASGDSQANGTAVETDARNGDTPSSILEKGVIYFFFRARVNVNDPQDVGDVARTYMVMRPIPHDAKLGEGPIGDASNCRLLALPKKVLPLSGKDRFMTFVESTKLSFSDLKDNFMSGSDYATKTVGTSHTPAVTPVAEGIYALTTTGRESHLAYIITIPSELGEVQKDLGLRERGSFVTSAKNPKFPGPANTNLPESPDYPKEIIEEFRDLRWMPLQPKLLDYSNTQFLLIGESSGIEKATEPLPRDEKKDKDTPLQEMEKLEGEDEIRVKHLKGNDAVFADLKVNSKDYPKLSSTW